MSFRSMIVAGSMALAIIPSTHLFAQEEVQQQPDVENSKFQFEGSINTNSVYVRSGPGDGYYPTQKIDKGALVTVVGIKFDWLKIVPPEGSFCYVAKAFVEKRGDGNVGRVTKPEVNIRAGSLINAIKTTVQSHLNVGDDVQIIGEQDEYFKIKPPQDAYLYIKKQFVDPVRALAQAPGAKPPTAGAPASPAAPQPEVANNNTPAAPPQAPSAPMIDPEPTPLAAGTTPAAVTTPTSPVAGAPATTQPAALVAVATPPTTQPAAPPEPTAEEKFATYEAQFTAISAKPLDEQPVEGLSKQYQSIAKADGLSDTLKRVVALRIATLNARADSKIKLAEARQIEQEAASKQAAATGELDELKENLKKTEVEIFAAVGTVQPSSLQLGSGGTLYRLTDPASGRTVIYVRSADNKLGSMIGQFVGVKGDPANDPQLPLRIITPTDIQVVDIAKVTSNAVAAQIMPPSLIGHGSLPSSSAN